MNNHKINLGKNLSSKKDDDSLGLIIRRATANPDQKHTGFVFLDNENGKPMIAHLTNCYRLEKNKLRGYGVLWLGFISERNAALITAELRMLGLREADMLNGIINIGGTKFLGGVTVPNPSVQGDSLTCATFILCMLEQFGFKVIDRDSWKITDEDTQWQADMVKILEPFLLKKLPEHYSLQKAAIGTVVRIRPEQLVGACGIFDYAPVKYEAACEAAEIVLEELDKL